MLKRYRMPWRQLERGTERAYHEFVNSLKEPRLAQEKVLKTILDMNRECSYGRRHGFGSMRSYDEYRTRVPIVSYDDIEHCMTHLFATGDYALSSERVSFCELTSGSTSAAKIVPFTTLQLEAFRTAIAPWLHTLAATTPEHVRGSMYFSISPAVRRHTDKVPLVPVGAPSDLVYCPHGSIEALSELMVTPGHGYDLEQIDAWRMETCCGLLAEENLSMVSIWSPTFFLALLNFISKSRDAVVKIMHSEPNRFSRDRLSLLAAQFDAGRIDWSAVWPRLHRISCWMDGPSTSPALELQRLFPRTHFDPKGLFLTEAPVSVPLHAMGAGDSGGAKHQVCASSSTVIPGVPCLNSTFLEFLDENGRAFCVQEIEPGNTYTVVVTTFGGLYRYNTGDQVLVKGRCFAAPCLEFRGRGNRILDLCGEKVSESFVLGFLQPHTLTDALVLADARRGGYTLLVPDRLDDHARETLAIEFEGYLCRNPHYEYARRVGQLQPVVAERWDKVEFVEQYTHYQTQRGARVGDVKPPIVMTQRAYQNMIAKPSYCE